jgi:hypothetical protein
VVPYLGLICFDNKKMTFEKVQDSAEVSKELALEVYEKVTQMNSKTIELLV